VSIQIVPYLEQSGLLPSYQSGFRGQPLNRNTSALHVLGYLLRYRQVTRFFACSLWWQFLEIL